jgi:hypothetical protein
VWGQHSFALINPSLDAKDSEGKTVPPHAFIEAWQKSKLDHPAADCKLRLGTLE